MYLFLISFLYQFNIKSKKKTEKLIFLIK